MAIAGVACQHAKGCCRFRIGPYLHLLWVRSVECRHQGGCIQDCVDRGEAGSKRGKGRFLQPNQTHPRSQMPTLPLQRRQGLRQNALRSAGNNQDAGDEAIYSHQGRERTSLDQRLSRATIKPSLKANLTKHCLATTTQLS